MASIPNGLICAGLALVLYACLGLPLAVRFAPRPLAVMMAPAIGWAVHSAAALALFFAIGMTRVTVVAAFAVPAVVAVFVLWRTNPAAGPERVFTRPVTIALIGAALLAAAVMAGVLPKFSPDGVSLAEPIFDHSKVAMIDEMARSGVPPANPFFGGAGTPVRLAYYYLWHFSAAELSLLAGVTGWEADAGLTWFTAFASLAMMIGLAVWFCGRATAAPWVVVLAATASMRPPLGWLFVADRVNAVASSPWGFGGWLFQISWAPQHMASAMSVVLAVFLLTRLVERPGFLSALIFALTMAAGFESSTWVGGIVFPLAAAAIALTLLIAGRCATALAYRVFDRGGGAVGAAADIAFRLRPTADDHVARWRRAGRSHALSGPERKRDQGNRTLRQSAGFLADLSCCRTSSFLSHGCAVAGVSA